MKYKLIKVNGDTSYKDEMTLEEMQSFVGGYVQLYKGIYCNEDGLLLKLPHNTAMPEFVGNIIQVIRK